MTEERKQHITLQLDAHSISLNVPMSKEHLYRKAAEKINQRYKYYQRIVPNKSAEQIWVYVALDMAVNLSAGEYANRLQPVDEKIQELNQIILQYIK